MSPTSPVPAPGLGARRGRCRRAEGPPAPRFRQAWSACPQDTRGQAFMSHLLAAPFWAACHAQPLATDIGGPENQGPRQCVFRNAHRLSAWDAPPLLQALTARKEGGSHLQKGTAGRRILLGSPGSQQFILGSSQTEPPGLPDQTLPAASAPSRCGTGWTSGVGGSGEATVGL